MKTVEELELIIKQANDAIPEGYQVAYDSLVDRVKAMVEGNRLFIAEIEEQRKENTALRQKILFDLK